jgi:hypothetical protein
MMSPSTPTTTAAPAYPPTAHAAATQGSSDAVATQQPAPAPGMSLRPEDSDADRARRVRGGCFPLPVRALSACAMNDVC